MVCHSKFKFASLLLLFLYTVFSQRRYITAISLLGCGEFFSECTFTGKNSVIFKFCLILGIRRECTLFGNERGVITELYFTDSIFYGSTCENSTISISKKYPT